MPQIYTDLDDVNIHNAWATIGTFDGVHLGHQAIVRSIVAGARAEGAMSVVITFDPHPAVVLGKRKDPIYLTTPIERARLLGELGVDVVVIYPFTLQVAATTAAEFMERVRARLGLRHLCVGHDFALGKDRQGNEDTLRELGERMGYSVAVAPAVELEGEVVSSSAIRRRLTDGDVEGAARMLGRPYRLSGVVVRGDGRGRQLGFPTANLEMLSGRAVPRNGVYVCQAHVNGLAWGAVTNVGVRPTFENQPAPPRVEAHLLDFDRDLYGQELPLEFLARLRDEARFSGIQALVAQIQVDADKARQYFR